MVLIYLLLFVIWVFCVVHYSLFFRKLKCFMTINHYQINLILKNQLMFCLSLVSIFYNNKKKKQKKHFFYYFIRFILMHICYSLIFMVITQTETCMANTTHNLSDVKKNGFLASKNKIYNNYNSYGTVRGTKTFRISCFKKRIKFGDTQTPLS